MSDTTQIHTIAESLQPTEALITSDKLSAAPVKTTDVPGSPAEDQRPVERFKDPSIPVSRRLEELDALARKGDPMSVKVLMDVGSDDTYLNFAAVEALGKVKAAGVAEYLTGKLAHPDSRVLAAAVRSLAAVEGEQAIAAIGEILKANRSRPDGHQDIVCGACVEALSGIGSGRAIPLLKAEFEETVGVSLHHEYGSQVVAALKQIGDPAAKPDLLAYAERLAQESAGMADNPMGQSYLREKIKEARDAAEALRP